MPLHFIEKFDSDSRDAPASTLRETFAAMNILLCLVLYVAFASCVSNESAGTAVDADSGVLHNDDLHGYLLHHENFDLALHRTYRALEHLLIKWIVPYLLALIKSSAVKGPSECAILSSLNGLMHLTGQEYWCYCEFYVKKIRWIRGALGQGNYSKVSIMKSIILLGGYIHHLAVLGAEWYESAKHDLEMLGKKAPPALKLLEAAFANLKKLAQGQWAVAYTCTHKYEEYAMLVKDGIVWNSPTYAASLCLFMEFYAQRKMVLLSEGADCTKEKVSKDALQTLLTEFRGRVVASDEAFQRTLKKADKSTPLQLPEDTEEEEWKAILGMILNGTAKKCESTAAKTDAKGSSASATKGAESGTKQEALPIRSKTKRNKQKKGKGSRLAVDQKPDGTGTGDIGVKIEGAENQIAGDGTGQALKQKVVKTEKQEKNDAKKEEKEMIAYTGGGVGGTDRELKNFVEIYENLEKNAIKYKDARRLAASGIWERYGVKKGNTVSMHSPHGMANWNSKMRGTILGIYKQKLKTIKENSKYEKMGKAIQEGKLEK